VAGTERVSDPLRPSTRKWDYVDPNDAVGAVTYNDQPYLRLAETYLLLAEAQFKQGRLPQAAASINVVRARAGASQITPAQVTMDFILDERSRELVTEEQPPLHAAAHGHLVRPSEALQRARRAGGHPARHAAPHPAVGDRREPHEEADAEPGLLIAPFEGRRR
jgi:hypothetical protein